jgi:hypothetical protein
LKLEYDGLLSNFGFKFNLRRCTSAPLRLECIAGVNGSAVTDATWTATAGAATVVGRCRLTL